MNIAYRVVGEGELDLVWVPNWLSNVDMWGEEPSLPGLFGHLRLLEHLGRRELLG